MKKIDLLSMSVRNLFRRKFRTFLTVLGVVIGCTSIILMLLWIYICMYILFLGAEINIHFYEYSKKEYLKEEENIKED